MKDSSSKFPSQIDERIFFQDISLDKLETINEYRQLIANEKYTQASQLLNDSNADFYGAWILNLLENRLVALENHIADKVKTRLVQYGGSAPTKNGSHWVN